MDKRKRLQRKGRNLGVILLPLPTLIWYVIFCYLPMFGIVIAFKRYKPIPGKGFIYSLFQRSPWVGLDNFKYLFLNPQMLLTVRNTLAYNLIFLVIDTILPVALAIMLSYLYSKRVLMAVQTAAMLPHFLSWVVVSYFLYAFLSTDRGFFNNFLINMEDNPVRWYQNPDVWPAILIITHTWKAYGYALVMYMAYITAIDQELYDSAIVDGADVFQMINVKANNTDSSYFESG